ncbi:MAG: glycoside hydrolase domain-containing protein [Methanobacteriota archaeon]
MNNTILGLERAKRNTLISSTIIIIIIFFGLIVADFGLKVPGGLFTEARVNPLAISGIPPLPAWFNGTVTMDGFPAPPGTVISAWIGGVNYPANFIVTERGVYGVMSINGDDPGTGTKEGGVYGETIIFKINGHTTEQSAQWQGANLQSIELSCTDCTFNIEKQLNSGWNIISIPGEVVYHDPPSPVSTLSPLQLQEVVKPKFDGYIIEFHEKPPLKVRAEALEEIRFMEASRKTLTPTSSKANSITREISELQSLLPDKLASQKTVVNKEQDATLDLIRSAIPHLKVERTFNKVINGISVDISEEEADALRALPQIKGVYPNLDVYETLMDSVELIEANDVWLLDADGNDCGVSGRPCITGANMTVAILDTGIDYTHPDLGGCLGPSCKVVGGWDFVNNDADPMDDNGHGTHCAATAAGNGALNGVAPDAQLYAFKVLSQSGGGSFSNIIAAIEKSYDLDGDGLVYGIDAGETNPNDIIDVISLSLGGQCWVYDENCGPDDISSRAIDTAVENGVIAVVAAGNCGPQGSSSCIKTGDETIGTPGTARKAITVGSTDKADIISGFSSRGPIQLPRETIIKPDVVAPGGLICAAQSSQDTMWDEAWIGFGVDIHCFDTSHINISGTSMATPHVSGLAAIMKQAHSNWTPSDVKKVMEETAIDLLYPSKIQGDGRVNASASVQFSGSIPSDEECELQGDEDGDTLSDCADVLDCHEGVFCNAGHTLVCNSIGLCMPPEKCMIGGDEDVDGLSDCADALDCPTGSYCDATHNKRCDFSSSCIETPFKLMWEESAGRPEISRSYGEDVVVAADGSVYVTGSVEYTNKTDTSYLWLVKYDSDGNLLWDKSPSTTHYSMTNTSAGRGVDIDSSGNVYATGIFTQGVGDQDLWLLKYGSNGNLIFDKQIPGVGNSLGNDVLVSSDGFVYVAGVVVPPYDSWLLKFDSNGNLIWNKTFGGSLQDQAYGLAESSDGSIYVTGLTQAAPPQGLNSKYNLTLHKFDSDGNLIWDEMLGGGDMDSGRGVSVASDGSVYVTGYTKSYGAGSSDVWILRFDSDGNLVWDKTLGGTSTEEGNDIEVFSDDVIYVTARTSSFGAGGSDLWLVEFDSDGNVLRQQTEGDNEGNTGNGISVQDTGDIYIAGATKTCGFGYCDLWLMKYGDPKTTATVDLKEDWNMFALPNVPTNTEIDSVLGDVDWNIISHYNASAGSWITKAKGGFAQIDHLTPGLGYWLKMNTDDTLTVYGSTESVYSPIIQGSTFCCWNMIGFTTNETRALADALKSIDGNWSILQHFDNGSWFQADNSVPQIFWSLNEMSPGKGYWLNAGEEETLWLDYWPPRVLSHLPTGDVGITRPTLIIETDENATCKGSIDADKSYASMDFTFTSTGVTHSYWVSSSLTVAPHTVYVKCMDRAGNLMPTSYSWNFTITGALSIPEIIPEPKEIQEISTTQVQVDSSWKIITDINDVYDNFTAHYLKDAIIANSSGAVSVLVGDIAAPVGTKRIVIGNPNTNPTVSALAIAAAANVNTEIIGGYNQGYILLTQPDQILVLANSTTGTFYGVVTLIWLLDSQGTNIQLPNIKILDWPDYEFRGEYGSLTYPDYPTAEEFLDHLARLKMNFHHMGLGRYLSPTSSQGTIDAMLAREDFLKKRHFHTATYMSPYYVTSVNPNLYEGIWAQNVSGQFDGSNILQVPALPNVALNTGFEVGSALPDGWHVVEPANPGDWSRDCTVSHSGSCSAKLHLPSDIASGRSSSLISGPSESDRYFDVESEKLYQLTFYVRKQNINPVEKGYQNIIIKFYNSSRQEMKDYDYRSITFKDYEGVWKRFTISLPTYGGVEYLWIQIKAQSSNAMDLWVDDLEIIEVSGALRNVLETNATELEVYSLDKSVKYQRDVDYTLTYTNPIPALNTSDVLAGRQAIVTRIPVGSIPAGATVLVDYDFLPRTTATRTEKMSFADPEVLEVYKENIVRPTMQQLTPDYILITMDEIWGFNRDSRSKRLGLENYQLFGQFINNVSDIIHSFNPNIKVLMYDDMVNPYHWYDEYTQVRYGGQIGDTWYGLDLLERENFALVSWAHEETSCDPRKIADSPNLLSTYGFDYVGGPANYENPVKWWSYTMNDKNSSGMFRNNFYTSNPIGTLQLAANYSWNAITDQPSPCNPDYLEVCDGIDNDCDASYYDMGCSTQTAASTVDEGYDLQTDPFNCGACGNICYIPKAFTSCVAGECQFDGCFHNYEDANVDLTDGCEHYDVCTPSPEFCDGVDNDCDEVVDEGCASPATDCDYYASPTGGGTGTLASPFKVSDFWSIAQPGHTLCLLDGIYTGSDSMINPPDGLSGSSGSPITVKAYRDGKAWVNGAGVNEPVLLDQNNFFVIEGLNAFNSSATVVNIARSHDNIIRRVVGWDAFDGNTNIFGAHTASNNNTFEDCAGFGIARKTYSNSQHGDNTTFRRCFGRWEGTSRSDPKMTFSMYYNSYGGLCENCVATWDSLKEQNPSGTQYYGLISRDRLDEQDQAADIKVLGSLSYVTADQDIPAFNDRTLFYLTGSTTTDIRDNVVYTNHPGVDYNVILGAHNQWKPNTLYNTGSRNIYRIPTTWNGHYYKLIVNGTTGSTEPIWPTISGGEVQDGSARWKEAGTYPPGGLIYANSTVIGEQFHNKDPGYWTTDNNIEAATVADAYGANENVFNTTRGANLCRRYVDGVRTGQGLWPWPMDERIVEAMTVAGYPSNKIINVTETITSIFGEIPEDCMGTTCTPTNGGVETCDGLDNDCDGQVDEGGVCVVGLVAEYPFSGNANDVVGGYHGTLTDWNHGNGDGNTPPQLVAGKYGQGYEFDGVDDNIVINPNPALGLGDEITLAAWVKTTSTGTQGVLKRGLWSGAWVNQEYVIRLANGDAQFGIGNGSHVSYAQGITPVNDGVWHYLTAVLEDGVEAARSEGSTTYRLLYPKTSMHFKLDSSSLNLSGNGVPYSHAILEIRYKDVVDETNCGQYDDMNSYCKPTVYSKLDFGEISYHEIGGLGGMGDDTWRILRIYLESNPFQLLRSIDGYFTFKIFYPQQLSGIEPLPIDYVRLSFVSFDDLHTSREIDRSNRTLYRWDYVESNTINPGDYPNNYVIYSRDYLEKVYPNTIPGASEITNTIKAFEVAGYSEPVTFSIYAFEDLSNVQISVSDLVKGSDTIPDDNITIQKVVAIDKRWKSGSGSAFGVNPWYLEDGNQMDVKAGSSQQVWLTVDVPGDANPGVYTGTVTISGPGVDFQQVDLEFTVHDIALEQPDATPYIYNSPYTPGVYFSNPRDLAAANMERHDINPLIYFKPVISASYSIDYSPNQQEIEKLADLGILPDKVMLHVRDNAFTFNPEDLKREYPAILQQYANFFAGFGVTPVVSFSDEPGVDPGERGWTTFMNKLAQEAGLETWVTYYPNCEQPLAGHFLTNPTSSTGQVVLSTSADGSDPNANSIFFTVYGATPNVRASIKVNNIERWTVSDLNYSAEIFNVSIGSFLNPGSNTVTVTLDKQSTRSEDVIVYFIDDYYRTLSWSAATASGWEHSFTDDPGGNLAPMDPWLDIRVYALGRLNETEVEKTARSGDSMSYYTTYFATMPEILYNRFLNGVYASALNGTGVYVYAYNVWGLHPYDDLEHPYYGRVGTLKGNRSQAGYQLVVPSWSGDVLDSVIYESMREGIEDSRIIATLEKAISENPGATANQAQAYLNGIYASVDKSFTPRYSSAVNMSAEILSDLSGRSDNWSYFTGMRKQMLTYIEDLEGIPHPAPARTLSLNSEDVIIPESYESERGLTPSTTYHNFFLDIGESGDIDNSNAFFIDEYGGLGNMKIYVDGTLEGLSERIVANTAAAHTQLIGALSNGYYFEGVIDEVKIWDVALNETEILSEMVSGAPAPQRAPVGMFYGGGIGSFSRAFMIGGLVLLLVVIILIFHKTSRKD